MNRRQPLAIALIWLATVAGASTLTWGVISSTGASVGENVPLSAATVSLPPATQTPTGTSASPNSSQTGPSATSKTTGKPSNSPTSTKPTPATKTASWSGSPGKVTASCKGSAVSLVSAIPNDGYKVQTEREGTKLLEVEFEKTGSGEDEDGEVHLKISCTDGAPVFRRD
ncbi:MAG: hypothetical protein L6256_03420 [Propionicimonas sp.]|uniref:hypothetical protein n=1 Tax=Propionicimonas sp. TaxID=1955623 RepID=UPI001E0283A0|nr:hypothetical protein [Propionicimonas sp.]MBU4186594.1 hypothetical protein [Actinomycetota bacterium]MBU4205465.1 hypothetical protein [Actinomycetota bacterium]MBU4248740.1 hypothetical protein [Actinomycetota bacterium]MBU4365277.1 hypothetical protein [Actinomycetota bacterium]MBU4411169.1 hypothetical protein [Actinomycetota bacterium]